MYSTRYLKYVLTLNIFSLCSFLAISFISYPNMTKMMIYWMLALVNSSVIVTIFIRWLQLNMLEEKAAIAMLMKKNMFNNKKDVKKLLHDSIEDKTFRKSIYDAFNQKNAIVIYNNGEQPMIMMDLIFDKNWITNKNLQAVLAWILATLPTTIHCKCAERKNNSLRLSFTVNNNSDTYLQEMCRHFLENLSMLLFKPIYHRIDIKNEIIPDHYDLHQFYNKPTKPFEHKIYLEKEKTNLIIGFNGIEYYSFFENSHDKRTFSTFQQLWLLWKHIDEFKSIFQKQNVLLNIV